MRLGDASSALRPRASKILSSDLSPVFGKTGGRRKVLKLLGKPRCLLRKERIFIPRFMKTDREERRVREKVEILIRLRKFAERSKWKKARLSRELGVSVSTVERWLDGQENILLASVLEIRRFLEEREFRLETSEDVTK
jgi:AraC-like DNA-binding protein